METVNYLSVIIALAGVALTIVLSMRYRRRPGYLDGEPDGPSDAAKYLLYGFAVIAALFGAYAFYIYRDRIFRNQEDVLYFGGLILAMIAGMFVQVLYTAYREHRKFNVTATQLILPLLFSIVVFYPTWAIASTAERSFFVIHAAFLNGFFWESLVTAAKPPQPPER